MPHTIIKRPALQEQTPQILPAGLEVTWKATTSGQDPEMPACWVPNGETD